MAGLDNGLAVLSSYCPFETVLCLVLVFLIKHIKYFAVLVEGLVLDNQLFYNTID